MSVGESEGAQMERTDATCSYDSQKSTKGASKLRRDLINGEIANLRDLLPLPATTRQRLSQLQLMALVCVYIRKANYFQQVCRTPEEVGIASPGMGFSKALTGFLVMMTQSGKLLYISDNAAEYLGHSMEDLLIHGDSFYDIIDKNDQHSVQNELLRTSSLPADDGRIFLCRMNVSRNVRRQMRFGDQKVVLVQGRYLSYLPLCSRNEPVFLARCTPVVMPETRECVVQGATNMFTSVHTMDMKYVHVDAIGEFYLGYSKSSLEGLSWYHLLHWESIKEAQCKHRIIIQSEHEKSCILLVRLQHQLGFHLWIHCVLQVKENADSTQPPVIICTNQVLSESEASVMQTNGWIYHYYSIQSKLQYGLPYEAAVAAPRAAVGPFPSPAAGFQSPRQPAGDHQPSPSSSSSSGGCVYVPPPYLGPVPTPAPAGDPPGQHGPSPYVFPQYHPHGTYHHHHHHHHHHLDGGAPAHRSPSASDLMPSGNAYPAVNQYFPQGLYARGSCPLERPKDDDRKSPPTPSAAAPTPAPPSLAGGGGSAKKQKRSSLSAGGGPYVGFKKKILSTHSSGRGAAFASPSSSSSPEPAVAAGGGGATDAPHHHHHHLPPGGVVSGSDGTTLTLLIPRRYPFSTKLIEMGQRTHDVVVAPDDRAAAAAVAAWNHSEAAQKVPDIQSPDLSPPLPLPSSGAAPECHRLHLPAFAAAAAAAGGGGGRYDDCRQGPLPDGVLYEAHTYPGQKMFPVVVGHPAGAAEDHHNHHLLGHHGHHHGHHLGHHARIPFSPFPTFGDAKERTRARRPEATFDPQGARADESRKMLLKQLEDFAASSSSNSSRG